jgi:phage gp46-like protein
MAAAIVWINPIGGDLALEVNNRIRQGEPLIAEFLLSLHTDAPADVGVRRDGYWAASFEDSRAIRGSKLWLLPYVRPASRAVTLARIWTDECLAWMVPSRLKAVSADAALAPNQRIDIAIGVTLHDDTRRTFRLDFPYAV